MIDIAVILNPGSGAALDEAGQRRLVELFAGHGRTATIFAATPQSPIGEQAKAAAHKGCRLAVAAGGDGTVNAVASAVLERRIPLGVLPVGTLNHFAKDLGMPLDLEEAVRVVATGRLRRVDVGEVNGRIFLNNSSLGVYPRIVALRDRYGGTGLGKWAAGVWASLAVLRRHPFVGVRVRTDDETVVRRTPFVFIGNNPYRMEGLHAASRDSLDGGRLALYVMHAARRRGLVRLGWNVVVHGAEAVDELEVLVVEEATVETRRKRLQVALDGEVVVLTSPLAFRTRPLALEVVGP